ncbi:AAA family ATPase [Sphingomonas lenta]|nr:ATP-binding protein [Sphingomonas lenta]
MSDRPILHTLCGKAAAGKSTLSAELARAPGTILVAQDPWMAALYPEMRTVDDYIRHVSRLRAAMGPHLVQLLRAGLSVVLDWPANTAETRLWMRGIAEEAGAEHRLYWLDLSDEACWERLRARNREGLHPYRMTRAQFDEITRYFEPPTEAEGAIIRR